MVSAAAAARHVASGIHRFGSRLVRRGFAADIHTPAAAWTHPLPSQASATPSGGRFLGRGLATKNPGFDLPDCMSWSDPEAPDPDTFLVYGEEDLATEEAAWALYERWRVLFGVKRDCGDMLRRFGDFRATAREIHEFNKTGASWIKGLNENCDETAEERAARRPRPRPPRPVLAGREIHEFNKTGASCIKGLNENSNETAEERAARRPRPLRPVL